MNKSIDFQVAFGAVRHFGRNLYTTNPPAITELIANSWDAYATKCYIFQYKEGLVILDNGIGMNFEELRDNYATSGNEKKINEIRIPKELISQPRKYMGRKGIGKFAAFSLGDNYEILTKSSDCTLWRHIELNYEMLNVPYPVVPVSIQEFSSVYDFDPDLCELVDCVSTFTSGTLIYIPKLNREFTRATMTSLTNSLPRRFSSVIMSKDRMFDLYINDQETPTNLQEHFYYQKIENIYIFGFEVEEQEEFFGKFTMLDEAGKNVIEDDQYFIDNNIKGWIGTVSTTSDLVQDDIEVSGVSIYINGKIADTDVFRELNDASVPNTYLVGAVDADFLQTDLIDPVLSSREGLNFEIENVRELRDQLLKIKKKTVNAWNTFRNSRKESKQNYLNEIMKRDEFSSMYEKMSPINQQEFKKMAQKLFDGDVKKLDLIDAFTPSIFTMVNDKKLKTGVVIGEGNEQLNLEHIINDFFDCTEINYALRIKSNFQNRLDVIKMLEQYQEEGAVEKAFQTHLFNNPWLINPTWDIVERSSIEAEKRFSYLNINNAKSDGRIDIIITPREEKNPVIVELKREKATTYSTPNVIDIVTQIKGYRDAIYQNTPQIDRSSTIKAYFICGSKALQKLNESDREFLKTNNISLHTFDSLIIAAKLLYEGKNIE